MAHIVVAVPDPVTERGSGDAFELRADTRSFYIGSEQTQEELRDGSPTDEAVSGQVRGELSGGREHGLPYPSR